MLKRIHHVGIVVRSLEEAYRFYRDALGLPVHKTAEVRDEAGNTLQVLFKTASDTRTWVEHGADLSARPPRNLDRPGHREPHAHASDQPFHYPLSREFVEPDWTRLPGYRGDTRCFRQ